MEPSQFSPNYSFVLPFEESFDKVVSQRWMARNWTLSLYLGIAYIGAVFSLKKWMDKRPPYNLRPYLITWNLILSVFSTVAAYRMLPEFLFVLGKYGYHYSVCNDSYLTSDPVTPFWSFVFVLSKAPELLDTVFVLLRKNHLIFLHWSHHALTLWVSWYVYDKYPAMARWVITMNYTIHSIMYSYYTLRAMKIRVPRPIAMFITISQILQMFFGFAASVYSLAMIYGGKRCDCTEGSAGAFFFIYSVLLFLFVKFFVDAYFGHSKSRPPASQVKTKTR